MEFPKPRQSVLVAVDSEFAALIQPLSEEEHSQLERNLRADGCREPLVVWSTGSVLLDGHNRLEICKSHGLSYGVVTKDFHDRDAAKRWMLENQLGRRNLTPEQIAYLRGKLYREEKKAQGGTGANQHEQTGQSDQSATATTTAERLANKFKVSEATIRRDAMFSKRLDDIVTDVGEDFRREVLKRDTKVTRKQVKMIAALPRDERKAAVARILRGGVLRPKVQADVKLHSAGRTGRTPDPKVADLDRQIRELTERGLTVKEITTQLKISPNRVHQARSRLRNRPPRNPLSRLVSAAKNCTDDISDSFALADDPGTGERPINKATADQIWEAVEALGVLGEVSTRIVKLLNKEAAKRSR